MAPTREQTTAARRLYWAKARIEILSAIVAKADPATIQAADAIALKISDREAEK